MKQEITFINKNGERIEFFNGRPYSLKNIDGLSKTEVTDLTSSGTGQHGETYLESYATKKQLIIGFNILSNTPEDYMKYREKMIKVFNPLLGEGILHYEYAGIIKEIKCKPESTPFMPITSKKNRTEGEVILLAYKPFLHDLMSLNTEIITWVGGLTFPFTLPFSLKQKGEPRINIFVAGHMESPVKIIFHGPAENPMVTNLTTGKFFRINRTLTSDETLHINTTFGEKTVEVEINGIRQNAFNYIDLDSTFFNLLPGDNLIEYTAGDGVTPKGVEIRYKNRYLGV